MKRRTSIIITIIAAATVILFCVDMLLNTGEIKIALSDIFKVFAGNAPDDTTRSIVMNFRLPKALVALMAGAALSAVGLQMQTLFRNPLAGPFVLGVSSGASLGVSIYLLALPLLGVSLHGTFLENIGQAGAAWIGASAILLIILAVTRRIKDIMAVLILGMMFGSGATAIVEILQYMSPEGAVKSFVVWTMGSLGAATLSQLWIIVPVIGVGLILSIYLIKPLNMLLLGENYARTMGLNIKATRTIIFWVAILLAGTITAFCGPISFIGLAVPHIMRMIFAEADHRVLMPASIIGGAGIMLLCDVVSQLPGMGSDLKLPINTITALIGIPIVVIVIVKNRKVV